MVAMRTAVEPAGRVVFGGLEFAVDLLGPNQPGGYGIRPVDTYGWFSEERRTF
jgi:hypothetical protein